MAVALPQETASVVDGRLDQPVGVEALDVYSDSKVVNVIADPVRA